MNIIKDQNYIIMNGDCLDKLNEVPDNYIDCIITDLPYGVTRNVWDTPIDLDNLWAHYKRVIKPGGNIILFGTQPFTSKLVMSNLDMFKYEIIWEKTIGSGQLNIKSQPLKVHENILLFNNKKGTYNEQLTKGEPYKINRSAVGKGNYNQQSQSAKVNTGYRHAKSIIKVSNPRIKGGHPTEKPLELLKYLVKTYSNKGDKILDSCMGQGSTGEASILEGRKFIGIELSKEYFKIAHHKLSNLSNKSE